MYAEYIDRAYQHECDRPEATVKCEFCRCQTPESGVTLIDNLMKACPVCDEAEKTKLRALYRDIERIIVNAMTEQPYTEQNGARWYGRPSLDTVAELIRSTLATSEGAGIATVKPRDGQAGISESPVTSANSGNHQQANVSPEPAEVAYLS